MAIPHICGDQVCATALLRTSRCAPLGLIGTSSGHWRVPHSYGKIFAFILPFFDGVYRIGEGQERRRTVGGSRGAISHGGLSGGDAQGLGQATGLLVSPALRHGAEQGGPVPAGDDRVLRSPEEGGLARRQRRSPRGETHGSLSARGRELCQTD